MNSHSIDFTSERRIVFIECDFYVLDQRETGKYRFAYPLADVFNQFGLLHHFAMDNLIDRLVIDSLF